MIRYCYDRWERNQEVLKEHIKNDLTINRQSYEYLVGLVTKYILGKNWDHNNITSIDNGAYQGTLLFLIPADTYQPSEYEYLMTYVNYGSCSYCDTLQSIQSLDFNLDDKRPSEKQVSEYMKLCKDLITNMICPYNIGWRVSKEFETITIDD